MESTAFFEKKISITPAEFNEVKNESIESLLEKKAKQHIENKCSEQGFVLPGTVKLLSRSMGYFESARFTADAVYYLKLEGKVVYPADGVRVIGEVIRKNKMGLYVDYHNAIRIQVPRDLHIGSEEYEEVDVGDTIEVELKRSKFQINDPYILASAIFIERKTGPQTAINAVSKDEQNGENEGNNAESNEDDEANNSESDEANNSESDEANNAESNEDEANNSESDEDEANNAESKVENEEGEEQLNESQEEAEEAEEEEDAEEAEEEEDAEET